MDEHRRLAVLGSEDEQATGLASLGAPDGLSADGSADRLLTADEVAGILGVPRSLVYSLVRNGEMPAVRIGERYIRFRSEALLRWIESRESCEARRRR